MYQAVDVRVGRQAERVFYRQQHVAGGLCQLLHGARLDGRQGHAPAAAERLLIVAVNDACVERLGLKQRRRHRRVGSSHTGNLCRRADDVVGHVAQLVERLQALEVAAVGKDILQVRPLAEHLCQRVHVHPCLLAVAVASAVVAVGLAACRGLRGGAHGVVDDPSRGVSPEHQRIVVVLRRILAECVADDGLHDLGVGAADVAVADAHVLDGH